MLTAAGFQLKGSGWYATDFKSKGAARREGRRRPKASGDAEGATAKRRAEAEGGGEAQGRRATPRRRRHARHRAAPRRRGRALMGATLRRYFVAGLLVWIPLGITLWVLKLLVDLMDQSLLLLPAHYRSDALFGFHVPGPGDHPHARDRARHRRARRQLLRPQAARRSATTLLGRIPIVRSIYGGVKQISDTLFSPEGKAFRRAVLVRYPHAGAWTVALVTGTPEHEVADILGREQISVFVPTTPNITAGFFLIVPRSETIELDMSVDEALKYIISMGVAEPAAARSGEAVKIASPSRDDGDPSDQPRDAECAPNTAATPTPVSSARPSPSSAGRTAAATTAA